MSGKGDDAVRNVYSGDAHAPVIQARDIGEVQIHLPPRSKHVPRGLPRAPLRLINRDREMELLDEVLEEADSAPGPVVAVLSGMRGVGKSAAGSHWTNLVRDRFADGDLSVDFAKRRRGGAVSVSEVLADLIRELEAPGFAVPLTLAERARAFGQITASRRLLMLLDDVASAAEIKPLLPNGAGSVVVVTSNFHLEELVHDGASLIPVDPLDEEASLALLRKMCGRKRIDVEPKQAKRLLEICGGLPVALCVCGARLARRRSRSLAWLVGEIEDEAVRLGGLSGQGGSVRAVFDFAYGDLESREALVYRRLGLHPGRDLHWAHAAVLADLPAAEAEEGIGALEDAHLLEPSHGEYHRQHDLLRLHARERAEGEDAEAAREAALRRLVEWYYACLYRADRVVGFDRLRLAPDDPPAVEPDLLPGFDSPRNVFAWFNAERPNLMAVLRAAAEREWDDRVWPMGEAMWLMLFNRQVYEDWAEATKLGVESAGRAGNPAAEARMRALLARAYHDRGELDRALSELDTALVTAEPTGHGELIAAIHEYIGTAYTSKEAYPRAIAEFEQARDFFVANDMRRGAALQDNHLGAALTKQGEPAKALAPLRSAVECMKEIGDDLNLARSMLYLGQAEKGDGSAGDARKTLLASLQIAVPLGMRHVEAQAHETLAEIAADEGEAETAAAHRSYAYEVYREIGHPRAEAMLEDTPGAG
ncbi:MAG TPA: NB-ARC domain-containing protein [Solirubrobacterales bacterium]|nr:NB-ARC domain-containing protein [Solirubrobacterales bacterium]